MLQNIFSIISAVFVYIVVDNCNILGCSRCKLCVSNQKDQKNCCNNYLPCSIRFAQGLRLRQVDMINDDISGSSATLSKMAQKLRDVCTTAMDRYQQARGQYIGGRQQFVTIDESHFRHKRKASSKHYYQDINAHYHSMTDYSFCLKKNNS